MDGPGEEFLEVADKFSGAHQFPGVDVNPDGISIAEFSKGTSSERFRGGMAEAGTAGGTGRADGITVTSNLESGSEVSSVAAGHNFGNVERIDFPGTFVP